MEQPENYAKTLEELEGLEDDGYGMDLETDGELSVRDSEGEIRWLGIARNAYENSTDYFDANIRKQIEKNIKLFQSKHPAGSKYHQESFKFRSKIFRPKTRSMVRRHEASADRAFFSTKDLVVCTAEDQRNPSHLSGAVFAQNLLNYRLRHSIPWFIIVIGAYQDAMTTGVVISRQEWIYKEKTIDIEVPDIDFMGYQNYDENGEPKTRTEQQTIVEKDYPDIVLLPIENFRFDPAADWRDPVGTSPYLIEMIPMYVHEVKKRMEMDNPKTGEKKWVKLSDGALKSATQTGDYDPTRMVREGDREDSKDVDHEIGLFDIVWVHRYIVHIEDEDYVYYTLGTEHLLSKPVPVTDVFLHGRPYAAGVACIETHKTYPAGTVEIGQDLQAETNDIANQRLDNIKLALNKRYLAKRGTNVDWRALTTSTPGGVVLVDDLNHVKEESMTDVTGSAYQEQDRINVDYDELMGTFNQSSVQTNRSLNETVGGMNMMQDDSNLITEHQLRVFTETWATRAIEQLLKMEIEYETDERILAIASGDEEVEVSQVEELIKLPMSVSLDIGYGATAPHKRIEKLNMGLDLALKYSPHRIQQLNMEEVDKEIFGALGYRDGSRFFNKQGDEDPQVAQLKQQLQQLQQIIDQKQVEQQGKIQVAQINNQSKMQIEQMKLGHNQTMEKLKAQLAYIREQIAAEGNDLRRGELILQERALEWQMKTEEINMLTAERDKLVGRQDDQEQKQYDREQNKLEGDGTRGDGLQDGRGSTAMANDQYQNVPMAEY